jgi:hypothetical protein
MPRKRRPHFSVAATDPGHELLQHAVDVSTKTGMCLICLVEELADIIKDLQSRDLIEHGGSLLFQENREKVH